MVERTVSIQNRDKKVNDSIKLILRYHAALNQLYEILRRAYTYLLKPPRLHSALPSQPMVAFRNPKAIKDKLGRLSYNIFIKMLAPIFVVILTVIYVKYLRVDISSKVRLPRKNILLILHLIVTVAAWFIYWHAPDRQLHVQS